MDLEADGLVAVLGPQFASMPVPAVVAVHAHLMHDVDDPATGTADDAERTGAAEQETTASAAAEPLRVAG